VHKKLRSKRLTPVLIKEITRRCHLEGIFQAIYTGGVVIPTPISTCRYHHRTLNVPKLVDAKFTYVPRNMTIARMVRQFKAPSTLALSRSGLREMEDRDVPAVTELFRRYMARFDMVPLLEEDDVQHQFLSGRGKGEKEASTGRRQGQVVWTYVVEASFSSTFHCQQFYNGTVESGISGHHRFLLVLYLAIDGRVEPAT
jgi:glycylpeptide N-tetradecanoyltransferase